MEHDTNIREYAFSYEDDNDGSLIYELSEKACEALELVEHEGQTLLIGNKDGLRLLGKICIQLAEGNYPRGYHLHIRKNFDVDAEDILGLILAPDATSIKRGNHPQ